MLNSSHSMSPSMHRDYSQWWVAAPLITVLAGLVAFAIVASSPDALESAPAATALPASAASSTV